MGESEVTDSWGGGLKPELPRVIYQVVEDSLPNVASAESDLLEQIKRHLFPAPAVSPPKATPIPSDYDLLIQRLMGTVQPVVQEHSCMTDIEIILQTILPVGSVEEAVVQPLAHRQESTAGCFLCGELDHTTERCPVLDESFPFLPPGWRAERVDN